MLIREMYDCAVIIDANVTDLEKTLGLLIAETLSDNKSGTISTQ